MKRIQWKVPQDWDGAQIKLFLRKGKEVSAQLLSRAKRIPGGILLNGSPAFVTARLHTGDCISFLSEEKLSEISPEPVPFSILYEDDDVLLVEKESGVPMYPTPGHDRDSLANGIAWYFHGKKEPSVFYPVYRLDRDTTGLVLLGRHSFAASFLRNHVEKEYCALCQGEWSGEGTERGAIGLCPGHSIQRCVRDDGEAAVTHWKTECSGKGLTFVRFHLETGRTHQIRVHMAERGTPLAGDDMYGGDLNLISRQALHCCRIQWTHPVSGETFSFESALPPDMKRILEAMAQTKPIKNG